MFGISVTGKVVPGKVVADKVVADNVVTGKVVTGREALRRRGAGSVAESGAERCVMSCPETSAWSGGRSVGGAGSCVGSCVGRIAVWGQTPVLTFVIFSQFEKHLL